MSAFAFPAGAAKAGSTVGVNFSSLAGGDGSAVALGPASAALDSREAGRCEPRVFRVGRGVGWGWNAFEID
jgi:hypothetical protein